jgi:hypothetical protein
VAAEIRAGIDSHEGPGSSSAEAVDGGHS